MTTKQASNRRTAIHPPPDPAFLQAVLDALTAHVAILDDRGNIIAANAAWRGYAESQGLQADLCGVGTNYLEICEKAEGESAEEAADVAKGIRRILEGKPRHFHREYPCHSPDARRWFQVRLTHFEDSESIKVVVAHESITEVKLAQEAAQATEERFRTVFESARDLIFIKDCNLVYVDVNSAVERLFGKKASDIIGLQAEDLYGPEAGRHIREVEGRVLAGQTVEEEYTRPVNGMELTFLDTRVPLRNHDGQIVGLCVISRNITERKRIKPTEPRQPEQYTSRAMQETLRRAQRAAATDSIVLLLGESGSGKDHLARWIHQHSARSRGPFFAINCAAVTKELAESELFGHESGAFTGARARKRGLLELAEGGTLLLNEIGELPLSLQAKLLTFLDTKSFLRVGGHKSITINARLIAATHRNLETEVAEGRFLEPLFYRINVFMIRVPPLRERIEDLPIIVGDLLTTLAGDLQLPHMPVVDGSALRSLAEYEWPGNIRELRNVLERSLMLSDSAALKPDLPYVGEGNRESSLNVKLDHDGSLQDALDEVTRFLLLEALRKTSGNAKQAAKLLGISRDSIYRHFKRLGLSREVRTQETPML